MPATAGRRPATTGTLPGSARGRGADLSPQLPTGPSSAKVSPRMRKRFYLTTAIDYVNGEPHLGHAYEKIVADVIARARRSLGEEVFFLTGLDEHGQKVQQAAVDSGKKPQAYCDDLAAVWKGFAKKLNLSNDDFVRTSEPRHQKAVQGILSKLNAAGHFYKAQYRGFYSAKEETFLTEKDRRADGTFDSSYGQVVELVEDNYYFHLREHQQWLIEHIESHPKIDPQGREFIEPSYRRNEVLGFLKNNALEDLCISRPTISASPRRRETPPCSPPSNPKSEIRNPKSNSGPLTCTSSARTF